MKENIFMLAGLLLVVGLMQPTPFIRTGWLIVNSCTVTPAIGKLCTLQCSTSILDHGINTQQRHQGQNINETYSFLLNFSNFSTAIQSELAKSYSVTLADSTDINGRLDIDRNDQFVFYPQKGRSVLGIPVKGSLKFTPYESSETFFYGYQINK